MATAEQPRAGTSVTSAGPVVIACITAVSVAAAIVVAMLLTKEIEGALNDPRVVYEEGAKSVRVPTVSVVAALLVVTTLAWRGLARRLGGPFGPTIAHVGVAATAPVFAYHAEKSLQHAIAFRSTFGIDYLEVEVVAPWAAFCVLIGCVVAWALTRGIASAQVARALRIAAGVSLAACAVATAFGAARYKRPDAEHFVSSLPVIATIGSTIQDGAGTEPYGESDVIHTNDGLIIQSVRLPGDCRIRAFTSPPSDAQRMENKGWSVAGLERGGLVRSDDAHHLLVITSEYSSLWLDAKTGDYAYPKVDRSSIGPPRRWVLGGVFGLIVAIIAMAWRPAAARRATRLAHAREGHSDGARITFEDGSPPFEPPSPVPIGPVLVLPIVERTASSAFRDQAGIATAEVFAGTLADARAAADAAWSERASLAIAALAITCAPLFVG